MVDFLQGGPTRSGEATLTVRLIAANSRLSPEQAARLDAFVAGCGQGWNPSLDRTMRETEFARLDALSDAALRAMGLTRAGLPAHVFRDLLA
ncbi:MAG: hypothetical protein ACK4KW_00430 [Gemmobacter sp.]